MAEKEYIEREAAYKLAKRIVDIIRKNEIPTCVLGQKILDLIDDIPAADVAPVVRCKECRHRDPEDHKCDSGGMERQGCPFPVHDDYFCAYGARMDGGSDNGT